MSLTTDGVWKGGVWASTVWALNVWYESGGGVVIWSGVSKAKKKGLSCSKELEAHVSYYEEKST